MREVAKRWRSRALLLAALSIAMPSPRAVAQTSPPASEDETFREGLERFDAGDHAGAVAIWEELARALAPDRAWKLSYNLGLAYEALGDATRAVERYERYVRAVAEQTGALGPDLEQRRQHAADRIRAIKSTHGAVRVLAPKDGAPAAVKIDERSERTAGFVAYLLPGSHVVAFDGRSLRVEVRAGATQDVDTTRAAAPPRSLPPVATASTPPDAAEPSPSFPTAWVLAGAALTLASFAVPLVLRGEAEDERDEAEKLGPGHTDYAHARDEYESARTLHYVSYGIPIAFGAATAAIAVVGIVRIAAAPSPAGPARGKRGPSVTVVPSIGGGSLWATARF